MGTVDGKKRSERRYSNRSLLPSKVIFEVSTHLSTVGARNSGSSARVSSQIKNISEGGICLSTKEPLEAAQVIKISLPLPHIKVTTPTLAEVCWVRKEPGKDVYHAGLRFLL